MKKLRAILQKSQSEMASLVGTAKAHIGHIESERTKIGPDFATKVSAVTGAYFIFDPNGNLVFSGRDWLDRKYTLESFTQWESFSADERNCTGNVDAAGKALSVALRRSFKNRNGFATLGSLSQALADNTDLNDDKAVLALTNLIAASTPYPAGHVNTEGTAVTRATFWTFGKQISPLVTHESKIHFEERI